MSSFRPEFLFCVFCLHKWADSVRDWHDLNPRKVIELNAYGAGSGCCPNCMKTQLMKLEMKAKFKAVTNDPAIQTAPEATKMAPLTSRDGGVWKRPDLLQDAV